MFQNIHFKKYLCIFENLFWKNNFIKYDVYILTFFRAHFRIYFMCKFTENSRNLILKSLRK